MLESLRKHNKLLMVLLMLLIIPSFIFFGIEGYTGFLSNAGKVARVDGQDITQAEWDAAHQQESERLRNANPNLPANLLDSPAYKYSVLENLVRQRVIAAAVADKHLSVSDERLAATLAEDPEISAMRQPDGKLDMDAYRRLLATQGLTPEGFEARVRNSLAQQQVLNSVVSTSFATPAQAAISMNAALEQRQVQVLRLNPADYASRITPSDEELQAHYQQNLASYQTPDTASVEYLVLDIDTLKKDITPSEQDLRSYYEQNQTRFGGTAEERRAAHILIAADKSAPAAERDAARAKAEEILTRLRQKPDTFAQEARAHSADDISAPQGGDLGTFQRGQTRGLDAELINAIFALDKAGAISDIVSSDFGFHIIQLSELKPAKVPAFDSVREQIADLYRTQQAEKRFAEAAFEFREGVYEQADSLQPMADKFKLDIQRADGITRTIPPGATGPLANPRLLSALFSSESIDKKRNTDAIETGPQQLTAGRIVSYSAAHPRPFDEVKDQVRQALIAQRAAALAAQEGQQRLQAWTSQPDSATGLPAAVDLSRENPQGQPPQLIEAVMRADPAKLPSFIGVDLGAEGYALVRIEKVLPRAEPTPEQAQVELQQYEQTWALSEASSYYESLKARYKAEILVPRPAANAPGAAPAN